MSLRVLISEAFELYKLDYILFYNYSKRAAECNDTVQRLLVDYVGDIPIEQLTYLHIRNWKLKLEEKRGVATVRNYILALRVVLRFLKNERNFDVVDADSIPIPKRPKRAPDFLTKDQVAMLIDHAEGIRGKAIISLLYSSGIRLTEMLNLNIGDIADGRFTVTGKGDKPRLCFTDARAEQYIEQYLSTRKDNNPALFVSRISKTRMTPTNVQIIVRGAAQRAGIDKHVTPHILRHSFATNILINNGNMRYLQAMLGHESLDTTAMYTHVVDNELQRIHTQFHTI